MIKKTFHNCIETLNLLVYISFCFSFWAHRSNWSTIILLSILFQNKQKKNHGSSLFYRYEIFGVK